jgi:hypothetical protein
MPGLNGYQLVTRLTPIINKNNKEIYSVLMSGDQLAEAENIIQKQIMKPIDQR